MIASGAVINDGKPHPELDGVMLASAAPSPAPVPASPVRLNEPAAVPATLEAEADIPEDRGAAGRRAVRRADTWLKAQDVLNRSDRKSRDLYLVLCGAGDRSSCVMAAALGRT